MKDDRIECGRIGQGEKMGKNKIIKQEYMEFIIG